MDSAQASAAPQSGMTDAARRIRLCTTDEVPLDQGLKVEADGLVLAVFNLDGEFRVTDDACTHGPGSLSEGFVECGVVECNFHQGRFDIRTGAVVGPPCVIPVKTYPCVVEDDVVYLLR